MARDCWMAFSVKNENCYKLKHVCISLIIRAQFQWAMISNNWLNESYTQSAITTTTPISSRNISTIDSNIMNPQYYPSWIDITDLKQDQQYSNKRPKTSWKKCHIITHPSSLQSARKIPTQYANHWTTVQLVYSTLTLTNLKLRGCM
jgi:hypothetical protein